MTQLEPLRDSDSSHETSRSPIQKPPEEPDSALVIRGALFSFFISGLMAFTTDLDTIPKLMFFVMTMSLGFGGIVSMFRGMATLTFGKWFKATGIVAVVLFILIVMMESMGILPRSMRSILSLDIPTINVASATARVHTRQPYLKEPTILLRHGATLTPRGV